MSSSITQASLNSLERKSRKCDGPPASGSQIDVRSDDPGRHPGRWKCIELDRRIARVVNNNDPLGRIRLAATAFRQRASDWGALWLRTRATTRRPRPSFIAPLSWIVSGSCKLVKLPMLSGRRLSVHPVRPDSGVLDTSDRHEPWLPTVWTFVPAPFGPQLAPVLTSQGRK